MALSLDEALGVSLLDENDTSIHIDLKTRQVVIPEDELLFGVESDDAVEVKHIVIDGRYDDNGKDLSELSWRVNFRNANGDKNVFPVTKVTAGDNTIEFDWLIRRSVVVYKGTVDFVVCAFGKDDDGNTTPEWNSTLGHGQALEGLEVDAEDIGGDEILDELKNLQVSNGLCDGFYAVNNGMLTGFNGVNTAMLQGNFGLQQAINANNIAAMQSTNALQTQLADCCCQNKQGQAQIQYDLATNTCAITNAIAQQTQTIMQNDNANYRQLHDEIVANQIAAKDDTIAQLRSRLAAADLAASQQAQNAYLVNQLRPPVTPAYVVTNPYAGTGTLPCQTAGCCGVSA